MCGLCSHRTEPRAFPAVTCFLALLWDTGHAGPLLWKALPDQLCCGRARPQPLSAPGGRCGFLSELSFPELFHSPPGCDSVRARVAGAHFSRVASQHLARILMSGGRRPVLGLPGFTVTRDSGGLAKRRPLRQQSQGWGGSAASFK